MSKPEAHQFLLIFFILSSGCRYNKESKDLTEDGKNECVNIEALDGTTRFEGYFSRIKEQFGTQEYKTIFDASLALGLSLEEVSNLDPPPLEGAEILAFRKASFEEDGHTIAKQFNIEGFKAHMRPQLCAETD